MLVFLTYFVDKIDCYDIATDLLIFISTCILEWFVKLIKPNYEHMLCMYACMYAHKDTHLLELVMKSKKKRHLEQRGFIRLYWLL